MLIEKELIEQAKEKLGLKNAEIMAELLQLEDFDTRNLKARCPYHNEDTASFIYDKKRYCFHCFGCQKTVDIIDVYMHIKNCSFLEAAKFLFDKADIEYVFGEMNVKTKRSYRYPKEVVCNNKDRVYNYLCKRGLSKETIDYLDIREDGYGNCVFNYYDTNDVLTLVKYRPSHTINKGNGDIKCWCQKDADTAPLLFNMNRINVTKPLLITEGCIDAASAIEAGFANTVSVPLGAGNLHWIEENYEWLNNFNTIIVWSDNDEAGEKMRKECVYRLGSWRTKYIITPKYWYNEEKTKKVALKDINDCLQAGGKEFVMSLILNAQDSEIESVIDYSDIREVDLSEIDGIYTGIKEFDHELMKLFYGTFNIVSGVNGSGKSSFLSQLICQSIEQEKTVWEYSKELPNYMVKNWQNYIFAGVRNIKEFTTSNGSTYYKVTDDAKKKIDEFYKGKIHVYKDGYKNTVEDIEKSMEDCARKYGDKLFIIDNLTAINFNCGDDAKWQKQVDLVNFCIDFAQKYHVVVVLVIHPKKLETMRRMTKFDVQGLGSIVDLAHRLITLYRVTPQDKKGTPKQNGKGWYKEPVKYDVILDVLKDRMRGRENMSIGMYYDVPSRRFYTNEEEYNYQYSWDKKVYADTLPYPTHDEPDPFQ